MIRVFLIALTLTGCASLDCPKPPIEPVAPSLPSLTENDTQGISLDKRDSAKLYRYIELLRSGYEQ